MAECEDRDRRRAEHRIRTAHLPREKSLREFDYSVNPNVDPAVIHNSPPASGSPSRDSGV
ncbi:MULTISPECIES: ATP-binding protein [unclassified Streptomyces]|uniref:ATP-binding protein n=1 Tax=unclassified Streptomyces TaxID=2593676 RepID=UPI00217DF0A2|nr:ATP-binding protein [Streptomyces sp. ZS0098]